MDWQSPSIPAVPDTCDMVVNRRISAGGEVFNTYGARKGNASLLAWYGFALDGNENDVVGWDLSEIAQVLSSNGSAPLSEASYRAVLHCWLSSLGSMVADESRLVYRPDLEDAEQRSFAGPSTALCVNSDAQLSVYLWVYLTGCAAIEELRLRPAQAVLAADVIERLVALLGAVMAKQVSLEKTPEEEDSVTVDHAAGDGTVSYPPPDCVHLTDLTRPTESPRHVARGGASGHAVPTPACQDGEISRFEHGITGRDARRT